MPAWCSAPAEERRRKGGGKAAEGSVEHGVWDTGCGTRSVGHGVWDTQAGQQGEEGEQGGCVGREQGVGGGETVGGGQRRGPHRHAHTCLLSHSLPSHTYTHTHTHTHTHSHRSLVHTIDGHNDPCTSPFGILPSRLSVTPISSYRRPSLSPLRRTLIVRRVLTARASSTHSGVNRTPAITR